MNITKIFLTNLLLTLVLAIFGTAAFAQKQNTADKILVSGAYVLRQSDFDSLAEFYQWLLGAEFSPDERRRFQIITVRDARARESNAKAVLDIAEGYRKLQAAEEEKRAQARSSLLPEIVAEMEKDEADEINAFLLGIYRSAQNKRTDAENDAPTGDADDARRNTMPGAITAADLAGLWSTSSVSGERYKSLLTGELSDPSGTIIEYQISPNGSVKHVGYLSITNYSCTSKLFISRTGRISISGSRLTFDFAPGKRIYQACSASERRTDTLPAERESYTFRLDRDQSGLQLCTEKDGKNICYRRKGN